MEVYVARQPIFSRNKKIYGYELLFRGGITNAFPPIDGDTATSKLLSNSFFNIGIEQLTGGKKAFVNFTEDLLLKKVPNLFPKDVLVVEILENVKPHNGVVEACKEIASLGYAMALDDFFYTSEWDALISFADLIKIDFMSTPMETIRDYVRELAHPGLKFLAEKVETHEEFQIALDMGFEFFQGYFFSKPQIVEGKRVHEISSVRQAVVLLGEEGMKLIVMAKLASDKPEELVRTSIIRARLCELLGKSSSAQVDGSELFTLGLFSLIDAIMDQEMQVIMKQLPLAEPLKDALTSGQGLLADFLKVATSYESGDWRGFEESTNKLGIDQTAVPELYLEALGWADSMDSI